MPEFMFTRRAGVLSKSITTANGLPSNNVNATFFNGTDYYIGTSSGLVIYNDALSSVSETITTSQGLNTNNIKGVVVDATNIYVATSSKLFYRALLSTGDFTEIPPSTYSLDLDNVCPSCDEVTSFKTRLYQVDTTTNQISETTAVSDLNISLASVNLRVNIDSPSTYSGSSCSNSSCLAEGFDCCLEGQCVNDSAERPEASAHAISDPADFGNYYTQAKADVLSDPLNFVNYPDVYYVCSQQPPQPTATPTPFPDAQATADARFEEEKKQYYCLQNVKDNAGGLLLM